MLSSAESSSALRQRALRFVVLMGIVSLCADMVYEGVRSISGPYLAVLGASGAAVGMIAGVGELIAYGLRLVFGMWMGWQPMALACSMTNWAFGH